MDSVAALEGFLLAHSFAVVTWTTSWCSKCLTHAIELDAASLLLRNLDPPIAFASINLDHSNGRKLQERFRVCSCSLAPSSKLTPPGMHGLTYLREWSMFSRLRSWGRSREGWVHQGMRGSCNDTEMHNSCCAAGCCPMLPQIKSSHNTLMAARPNAHVGTPVCPWASATSCCGACALSGARLSSFKSFLPWSRGCGTRRQCCLRLRSSPPPSTQIHRCTHLRIHTSTHPCIHASTHAHAQVINQLLTMRDEIIVAERAVEAGLRVERAGAS